MQMGLPRFVPHAAHHESGRGDDAVAYRTSPLHPVFRQFTMRTPVDVHQLFLAQIEGHRMDTLTLKETAAAQGAGDVGPMPDSGVFPFVTGSLLMTEKENDENEET
jgi:hypothetical protein